MINPPMALLTLTLLQIKHFLVDWLFQTDYQIEHKGKYLHLGGLTHTLQHGLFTVIAVAMVDPLYSLAMGILDTVVHYHIDWVKQNLSHGLTPSNKKFWVLIGMDQLAHQLTYIAIIYLIS